MEMKSKNLVINEIPEKPDENCKTSVTTFLKNIIPSFSADSIENAYPLGKPAKKLVRGVLVKFKNFEWKQNVMAKKSALIAKYTISQGYEWEKKKEKLMKSVLLHKFDQNPVLKEKLINTGKYSLLECTMDTYWSTGQILDSPNWNKSYNYKGLNRLGHLLEEIRNQYSPAANTDNVSTLDTSREEAKASDIAVTNLYIREN